jgi:hypothetical protein
MAMAFLIIYSYFIMRRNVKPAIRKRCDWLKQRVDGSQKGVSGPRQRWNLTRILPRCGKMMEELII